MSGINRDNLPMLCHQRQNILCIEGTREDDFQPDL